MPAPYSLDPTGSDPDNLVTGEVIQLTSSTLGDYGFIIPAYGPFYGDSLEIVFTDALAQSRALVVDVDYVPIFKLVGVSDGVGKPVFGGIVFIDNTLVNGSVEIEYQTLGGAWNISVADINDVLNSTPYDPTRAILQLVLRGRHRLPSMPGVEIKIDTYAEIEEIFSELSTIHLTIGILPISPSEEIAADPLTAALIALEIKQGELEAAINNAQAAALAAVEAKNAAVASSVLYSVTWAELSGKVGSFDGQGGIVVSDAGSHTDPVKAGSVTVQNFGQYRWVTASAAWEWLTGDTLGSKASKTELANLAGRDFASANSLLSAEVDPYGNVVWALRTDGTRIMARASFNAYDNPLDAGFEADAKGAVKVIGKLGMSWPNGYRQYEVDLTGTPYANAVEVECDQYGFASRIVYANGRIDSIVDTVKGSIVLQNQITLPDGAQGQNVNGGFTCTGLDRDAYGLWIVGNDGRTDEGSSVFNCSVVILHPDFKRIFQEIPCNTADYPGIQSIQGVAWDSSDDTLWFVDKTNQKLRHMTRAGVKLLDEITVAHTPNGLAYDPINDALWTPHEGAQTATLISCATGAVLNTVTVPGSTDQIHYDSVNKHLYYTYGNNGTNGYIGVVDVLTNTLIRVFSLIEGSQAIEGIYVKGNRLWTLNDGAFHTAAKPPLDIVCEYKFLL